MRFHKCSQKKFEKPSNKTIKKRIGIWDRPGFLTIIFLTIQLYNTSIFN